MTTPPSADSPVSFFNSRARLVECSAHLDQRGILHSLELAGLSFSPRRVFTVSQVPAGEARGGHAHRRGEQLLICVQGRVEALMRCDGEEISVTLSPGSAALLFGPGVWCRQTYLTPDAALVVLASEPHDPSSYIYAWT